MKVIFHILKITFKPLFYWVFSEGKNRNSNSLRCLVHLTPKNDPKNALKTAIIFHTKKGAERPYSPSGKHHDRKRHQNKIRSLPTSLFASKPKRPKPYLALTNTRLAKSVQGNTKEKKGERLFLKQQNTIRAWRGKMGTAIAGSIHQTTDTRLISPRR